MATTEKLDYFGIGSESRKIISPHSRHILALSVIFILPLSLLIIAFPSFQHSITYQSDSISYKPIIFSLLYAFALVTLFLCAIATVSYSAYHGFFGRPINLTYAFRSLSNSLLRLFLTFLTALFMILVVCLGIGLIMFGVIRGVESLGFVVEYTSGFHVVCLSVLGFGLVCLYANWVLAPVIVVVESSWGLEPLRRSTYLVKGRRSVVVCFLFVYGLVMLNTVYVFGNPDANSPGDRFWGGVIFVVQIVYVCAILMTMLPYITAANTVLYINCRALRGELAGEIAEESAPEYVSLPNDEEENVPHPVQPE